MPRYSNDIIVKFKKTILKLQFADNIREIKSQKGLNFEGLKGDYKGYFSVRVDQSYRLVLAVDKDENVTLQISFRFMILPIIISKIRGNQIKK